LLYTPTDLQGYVMGTSLFNAYNSTYYLNAIGASASGLFSFNTLTNEQTLSNYTAFTNISEIDMSTGKIYNMNADLPDNIVINEYDISTGAETEVGRIIEPGLMGLIADASGFDSNNGILYQIGFDSASNLVLYAISVREEVFTYTKTILTTTAPGNNIMGLNYDNANNKLFALNFQYSASGTYLGSYVVEISLPSGDVITLAQLTGFNAFQAGSSSFDQNTGTFLLVAFDENFSEKMIAYNTYDNTRVAGYVPGGVSEIVCNNYSYALKTYLTTQVNETQKETVSLYPNPASLKVNLINNQNTAEEMTTEIYSSGGKLMYSGKTTPSALTEINISAFSPGLYVVKTITGKKASVQKLIVE
jgi:hypothetical protein